MPLTITVQITSSSGSSYAAITATSQSDTSKHATSVLTTTSTTRPILRDVEIIPSTATQTGDVGTTVTYTLRITNTGTVTDFWNLSISGPVWGTTLSLYGIALKPREARSVEVCVQIPASASSGTRDTATITVRSAGDPTVIDSSILTRSKKPTETYLCGFLVHT